MYGRFVSLPYEYEGFDKCVRLFRSNRVYFNYLKSFRIKAPRLVSSLHVLTLSNAITGNDKT